MSRGTCCNRPIGAFRQLAAGRLVNALATVAALFVSATGIQSPAAAATFNVSDAAGLRSALLAAAANGEDDVIVLAAGTYATGGTTFTFATNENKTLTLQGASGTTRSQVVLDGGGTTQVLNFSCVGSCASMITLQGLTVQNGFVEAFGSGAGVSSNILTLSDVDIYHNGSGRSGGAISSGNITVTNSSFRSNASLWGGDGGAISGSGTVANSSFSNNVAAYGSGGAISGNITVTNSTFSDNWSYGGGAISGSGTVTHSTFTNNLSRGSGGAIHGSWTVANSIFSNNRAYGGSGGAIDGSGLVVNSTFGGNSAIGPGAAIYLGLSTQATSTIINSVFYGHAKPAIHAESAYNLYNNLIDTGTGIAGSLPAMGGNVSPGAASPFVDAANGNFQLAAGSPAINAGLDPNSKPFADLVGSSADEIRQLLLTDLQGNPRPTPGTRVDMGAYESGTAVANPNSPTITGVTRNYGGSAMVRFTTPPPFGSFVVTCSAAGQATRTGTGSRSPITVKGLAGNVAYSCVVSTGDSIVPGVPSAPVPVTGLSVVPMMMLLLD